MYEPFYDFNTDYRLDIPSSYFNTKICNMIFSLNEGNNSERFQYSFALNFLDRAIGSIVKAMTEKRQITLFSFRTMVDARWQEVIMVIFEGWKTHCSKVVPRLMLSFILRLLPQVNVCKTTHTWCMSLSCLASVMIVRTHLMISLMHPRYSSSHH